MKYHGEKDGEIRRMYVEEQKSMKQIGQKLGLHVETVKRRLVKMGVQIRGHRTSMLLFWKERKKNDS